MLVLLPPETGTSHHHVTAIFASLLVPPYTYPRKKCDSNRKLTAYARYGGEVISV
jgi:hypothetical protein